MRSRDWVWVLVNQAFASMANAFGCVWRFLFLKKKKKKPFKDDKFWFSPQNSVEKVNWINLVFVSNFWKFHCNSRSQLHKHFAPFLCFPMNSHVLCVIWILIFFVSLMGKKIEMWLTVSQPRSKNRESTTMNTLHLDGFVFRFVLFRYNGWISKKWHPFNNFHDGFFLPPCNSEKKSQAKCL